MSIVERFRGRFGKQPTVWRAPGRVNLIGEHTDYNEGLVLPVAIELATEVAAAGRDDHQIVAISEAFEDPAVFNLDDLSSTPRGHWSDYLLGTVRELQAAGYALRGADLLIETSLPLGGGLSSSAALEVSVASALLGIVSLDVPALEIARLCQSAEMRFVGTQCGIMDMLVSTTASEGHATLIDCRSLETRFVPLPEDLAIVIIDSGVRHDLAAGIYNQRRAECEAATRILAADHPEIRSLRDLSVRDVEERRETLGDLLYRRARHVVSENQRVTQAVQALATGDEAAIGRIFAASHASLRHDYEVSCSELDQIVELAAAVRGIVGARMTGGGFGGSVVALARSARAPACAIEIVSAYRECSGQPGKVHLSRAVAGAGRVALSL